MKFDLKKWNIEDIADVAQYANNEKIANNLRDVFPYPYTKADAAGYVKSCVANDESRQICRAIMVDNHVVGSIGIFLGMDVYRKSAEIGYWLAEEFWGNGIMSAAAKQICEEAFQKFDIIRIYAEPFAYNTGSRKVLENAGFELEGIMKNGVVKKNKIIDYCMYALTKNEDIDIWESLYKKAKTVQNDRKISPFIEAGCVAAAILTKKGHTYLGVCIDTNSSLGMCAERNAIANMITNGESQIDKVVAIMPNGKVGSPCGACREYMMQLDKNSRDIEILVDYDTKKVVTLRELIPNWWGRESYVE